MRSSDRVVARADALRLRWLTVVVVVMAALTVGWPLVNLAVANRRTLAAGMSLVLGPSQADLARITVGPGWSMMPSQTDPRLDYALRRGKIDVTISYVAIIDSARTGELWAGLRRVILISNPGVRLGPPSPYRTLQGLSGAQGAITSPEDTGTATVVRSASGTFAIETIIIGPRHASHANLIAAHRIIHSIHMAAPTP